MNIGMVIARTAKHHPITVQAAERSQSPKSTRDMPLLKESCESLPYQFAAADSVLRRLLALTVFLLA